MAPIRAHLALALALVAVGSVVSAESLADIAKKEKERRAKVDRTAKSYDEATLARLSPDIPVSQMVANPPAIPVYTETMPGAPGRPAATAPPPAARGAAAPSVPMVKDGAVPMERCVRVSGARPSVDKTATDLLRESRAGASTVVCQPEAPYRRQ